MLIAVVLFLFGSQSTAHGQGFGGPVVKYSDLNGQGALMVGGRGGWRPTPSLALGFGLYGTVTEVDGPDGNAPNVPGVLDLKFESFGLDLVYAVHPASPTHLTIGAFVGGGALHNVKDHTNEQQGETDFLLVLEPALGVERRVTDRIRLNLAVSYRLVRGVEQPRMDDDDINGPAVSLAFKFGRF
jgi:hypothetical protein